jgi:hypothetical protein
VGTLPGRSRRRLPDDAGGLVAALGGTSSQIEKDKYKEASRGGFAANVIKR